MARIERTWTAWRGQAIEPVIRDAVSRLAGDQVPAAEVVGSYWTRSEDLQIDLAGADREPIARQIRFAGPVKWRVNRPFGQADLYDHRSRLPGDTDATPLVAVSRDATPIDGVHIMTAEDMLEAWHAR